MASSQVQTSSPLASIPDARPRILCVDDEPKVLEGLRLNLRRRFDVTIATGGHAGLKLLESDSAFAVVLTDMRMPLMSGSAFLAQVHRRFPDTVRVLLTGHSDVEAAIEAVNEGQIFRFLTKPCDTDRLISVMEMAAEQHRLVTAERVLLEQTLRGSVKALTEVLAVQHPNAFGRATRTKAHVAALAAHLGLGAQWSIEVAAMLCPIATISLPGDTLEKLYDGRPLTAAEGVMVKRLPALTDQILANIPRLEPVREILAHLDARFDGEGGPRKGAKLPLGARMLRLAIDYDLLETQGLVLPMALDLMRGRQGVYDPELLASFGALLGSQQQQTVLRETELALLQPGMVFADDVRSPRGDLLVARGHEITQSLIERLRNFARTGGVTEPLRVAIPARLSSRPQ
jgi:response regulator RpfG family c-di-GMP phosphodiesterase